MNLPDILQLSGSYWHFCMLHAGVKLDVFTKLTEAPAGLHRFDTTQ